MKLIAATQNKNKLKELSAIFQDSDIELVSQADIGLGNHDVEETGTTMEENSFIKANEICRLSGHAAIADDTGLCVDALGGAPGVYSARYSGVHGDDAANRARLLKELQGVPPEKRTAHFECVITIVYPDGSKKIANGICCGHIAEEERGSEGFGYDKLFIPEGYEESFAQLGTAVKNVIGHRAKAIKRLEQLLKE